MPNSDAVPLDPALAAYLAGVFDGEGTVCVTQIRGRGRSGHHPRVLSSLGLNVSVAMCDDFGDGAVPLFSRTFGRKWWAVRRNARPVLQWKQSGWGAIRLLKTLQPFLRVKRRHVDLALEFQETMCREYLGRTSVPTPIAARREQIRNELATLNHSHWARKRLAE